MVVVRNGALAASFFVMSQGAIGSSPSTAFTTRLSLKRYQQPKPGVLESPSPIWRVRIWISERFAKRIRTKRRLWARTPSAYCRDSILSRPVGRRASHCASVVVAAPSIWSPAEARVPLGGGRAWAPDSTRRDSQTSIEAEASNSAYLYSCPITPVRSTRRHQRCVRLPWMVTPSSPAPLAARRRSAITWKHGQYRVQASKAAPERRRDSPGCAYELFEEAGFMPHSKYLLVRSATTSFSGFGRYSAPASAQLDDCAR